MNDKQPSSVWSCRDSAELYGVADWGAGYFGISESGEAAVYPRGDCGSPCINLMDVVSGLNERGLSMPVLVRLEDILDARIRLLHDAFARAMEAFHYRNVYRGVYPIKVNQQQQVVENIATFGAPFHHGLEAGSKAELIAALAYMQDTEAYIICNGYKDREFIDLGLHALKTGMQCILVVETPEEVPLIIERAEAAGVRPLLGLRAKLSTNGKGHWQASGGDHSAFGLNAAQAVDTVDLLREHGMLDCLQLLHYHLGSQIPDIRDIRTAVTEACRIYAGLRSEGAPMGILDLGGGLAVDYDGSHTNVPGSANYSIDEYCADIIEVIMSVLDPEDIPHPVIVTESGRATVAYYSVLLFNILDVGRFETHPLPEFLPDDAHEWTRNLRDVVDNIRLDSLQECYHDATYYRDEIRQWFRLGQVSLRERGLAEAIYWHVIMRIARDMKQLKYVPDEFNELESRLADIYYGNFSVFQSLPDTWAMDQLFPIMPLHRLDEQPDRRAVIADITCDSDGKIDRFIDLHDVRRTLPLHALRSGEEYYLGVFLVGAYQETLGDLHNLLGDTHVISIRLNEEGHLEFEREVKGDRVADVLSYVEYEPKEMTARVRRKAEQAVRSGRITVQERRQFMEAYEAGLRGYTYFEKE